MKKICVFLILLFLCSCHEVEDNDYEDMTIKCKKEVVINEQDGEMHAGNYIAGYVVWDGKLNRVVHVREYMRDSFSSTKEYEEYMRFLQDSCFLRLDEDSKISTMMPYYEPDRIVYPYSIFDYTDLGKYTETEVPTQVRTEDGKSIDFELYWEYIQQNGVLDGFACTLEK
ncbi:MAG: hypothetical protein IJO78_06460 [Erysipelotrichaceae bacterium]|nr:hypothetical protein [Erysipelotrichaceae bacterium]